MSADEKEVTFYMDDRGVRVTNSRLMLPNTTYAMANITSVSTETIRPDYSWAILLMVVGVIFAAVGFTPPVTPSAMLGLVMLAAGILWIKLLKPHYWLKISSASGDSTPLEDKAKPYVDKLVQAINEAFIHRG